MMMLLLMVGCSSGDSAGDDEVFLNFKQINTIEAIRKLNSVTFSANELNNGSYTIYNNSISSQITTYDEDDNIASVDVGIKDYEYGFDKQGNFYTNINLTGSIDKHEDLIDPKLNKYDLVKIEKNGVNVLIITNVKNEYLKEYVDKFHLGSDVDKIETTFILENDTQRILYRTDTVSYKDENKEKTTIGEYEYHYDEDNSQKEIRNAIDLHFEKADGYRLVKVITDPNTTVEQLATFKVPVGDKIDLLMKQGYKIDMENSSKSDANNAEDMTYYVVNEANNNLIIKPEEKAETKEEDSSGFVLLSEAIPDAILEIRYYSTYNFVGTRIDGYKQPVALLTKEAAEALKKVSDELVSKGYRLKIYDAYRPSKAVDHFVRWSKNMTDTKMKEYFYPELDKSVLFEQGYIMEKSGHSRGSTVDLTLFDMTTEKEVDMGGTFDYFGELSHPDYKEITTEQYSNRMLLRETMIKYGFNPLEEEWWHFTLKDEPYPDTYFNFDVSSDSIR